MKRFNLILILLVACGGSQPVPASYEAPAPSPYEGYGASAAPPAPSPIAGYAASAAPPDQSPYAGDGASVAPPALTCNDGLLLSCSHGTDGCINGRTLYHTCVPTDATPGWPCAQAMAAACPADQADACLWTPAAATTHMCIYRGR